MTGRTGQVTPTESGALVVDTSAWIEFLQATGSPAHLRLVESIVSGTSIVVPEVVRMELLIGGTSEEWATRRRRMVDAFDIEPSKPLVDSEEAAAIHRACRRGGETVRNLIDCQVAATAIRLGLPVLHRDRDFEVISEAVANICPGQGVVPGGLSSRRRR